ncbi:MAG: hypothetical protein ABL889_04330 [Terricaulis sp.]
MKRALLLLGAVAGTLMPALALAAPLGGGQSPDINLVRIGLSLVLCLIIAGAAILILRRKGNGPWLSLTRASDPRAISVKETRRISLHAELCRFESDGQEFLIVVTPQGATLLRERPSLPTASP